MFNSIYCSICSLGGALFLLFASAEPHLVVSSLEKTSLIVLLVVSILFSFSYGCIEYFLENLPSTDAPLPSTVIFGLARDRSYAASFTTNHQRHNHCIKQHSLPFFRNYLHCRDNHHRKTLHICRIPDGNNS